MSLFSRRGLGDTPNQLVPLRQSPRSGSVTVNSDSALRSSAVWAALRLRADLISTMPVDVYRQVGALSVNVPTPPILSQPGGPDVGIQEWLYSSQFELDRTGNCFGIISEMDGAGKPRRIDLVDSKTVTVIARPGTDVSYRINSKPYTKDQVWHERQFTVPGMVMGLSPVTYAAWAIGEHQSALQFGLEWFGNGAQIPGGHFKNTSKTMLPDEADKIKRRYKEAIASRDVLVTGNDWEFTTTSVQQNESQFLDTQHAGEADIARFFGVPGDLIDIESGRKSAVTYASITQRNLQFLIMNLGPVYARREVTLSNLLPAPRFAKFNTDALLRMDPDTRNTMILSQLNRTRTSSELRAIDDLPPFTPAQLAEIEASTAPTFTAAPAAMPVPIGENA